MTNKYRRKFGNSCESRLVIKMRSEMPRFSLRSADKKKSVLDACT